ncbi:ABC transporter permease [Pseudobacter ginsenosidimutans]|uniref:Putative ABC transport system permease protein n=1 Tax=Pseudobacter ginsenosidimutans TaxID=661488 RepID=A0A4Q7MUQ4_9BACT|nr:ABC transporter permease [Pseudobacter ginsenosidimutans]QEC40649.1 FtsX-like permease family protein [Pseudobacter ginsenosidimutans]RZS72632.1 putative ABC transport system permease protein [Pseudobacter ginsenosidimutans]
MIKSFLRISWRNTWKNRSFTLISLSSLILGITLFFLISLWARDELSFDAGFANGPAVCRVETQLITPDGGSETTSTAGWPVGKHLRADYPDIASLTYLRNWRPIIKHQQAFYYEKALLADEHFFSVFGYPLQEGSAATALKDPFSLVISAALKEKYFGSVDALGKVLVLDDSVQYRITGVFGELPENSHLKFDMIGSFASFCSMYPLDCEQEFASGWFDLNVYNYVKLQNSNSVLATQAKISNLVLEAGKEAVAFTGFKSTLSLRPVQDIYLYSDASTAGGPVGSIKMVKLFGGIGLFILLIACLNFINLSTAKSVERAKEIGVQKVLGSSRGKLILQFLTEAAFLCLFAAGISLLLTLLLLQPFNQFTGKSFTWLDIISLSNLSSLFFTILILIPLAGFYPALVLSGFKPISVLKGNFGRSNSGALLRKALVITQFIISAGLIMATIIMWRQMQFMQSRELGFDKGNTILVSVNKVPWMLRHERTEVYKTALLGISGVKHVSACNAVPGRTGWNGQFAYPEGRSKEDALSVEFIPVDADYVKTIGLQLSAGRDFLKGSKADEEESFIINEAAAAYFGWGNAANALGKKLSTSGKDGRVVGVLKDYHQHGLQESIRAVVLSPMANVNLFAVRYEGIAAGRMIENAKAAWDKVYSGYPMEYFFLDEDFQQQYKKEEKQQAFMAMAAVLAIVIGSMGLLGLVIYTAQRRVKEIGIRKVLGASVAGIVALLSFDLLKLVAWAVLLTVPLTWWLMHTWLQQFAYRVAISWWIFVVAGVVALLVALLTISIQAVRAALANPVNSLKSE